MKNKLESFPYLTQTDNKWFSSTSCYPTSMAMAMYWCLKLAGNSEYEIGCPLNMQLEDYISKTSQSKETKNWIKQNISKYGNWMLDYKPRVIAHVESMIFNKLMNHLYFKATFSTQISLNDYITHLDKSKMPIVLHGNFKTVSKVAGHIVCGVGYNESNNNIIVMDPFGNALHDKYKSHEKGEYAEYPASLVMKDQKNQKMWGQIIERF
ncbi:MAG: hypothetical protein GY853_09755 [PVC group bacterium]|nr:hypothetical protein [PVC group bacterium]